MINKWQAKFLEIWADKTAAIRDNDPCGKNIKPHTAKVLFANTGKIEVLEVYKPSFGIPYYFVELPSGQCLAFGIRRVKGEGYDYIDLTSIKNVEKNFCCCKYLPIDN
mgnify:CR=1 FL=1